MPTPPSFVTGTAIASAVTTVAAAPTTAAHFALYNGDPVKSYYITSVSCSYTTSAAAAENVQLFAHISVAPLLKLPTATAAQGPKSLGSGVVVGTLAQAGSTLTIVNDGVWHPVGWSSNSGAGTATIALGSWVNLINTFGQVLYVIPPGGMISFASVASTAAGATATFVTWYEQ
jgi:hypothetical protein